MVALVVPVNLDRRADSAGLTSASADLIEQIFECDSAAVAACASLDDGPTRASFYAPDDTGEDSVSSYGRRMREVRHLAEPCFRRGRSSRALRKRTRPSRVRKRFWSVDRTSANGGERVRSHRGWRRCVGAVKACKALVSTKTLWSGDAANVRER